MSIAFTPILFGEPLRLMLTAEPLADHNVSGLYDGIGGVAAGAPLVALSPGRPPGSMPSPRIHS